MLKLSGKAFLGMVVLLALAACAGGMAGPTPIPSDILATIQARRLTPSPTAPFVPVPSRTPTPSDLQRTQTAAAKTPILVCCQESYPRPYPTLDPRDMLDKKPQGSP